MATFGELLSSLMKRHGLDKDVALGVRLGVSNQAIQKWRTGKQVPGDPKVLDQLVEALGLINDEPAAHGLRDAYMRARDPVVAAHFEAGIRELRRAAEVAEVMHHKKLEQQQIQYEDALRDEHLGRLSPTERDLIWVLRSKDREIEEPGITSAVTLFLRTGVVHTDDGTRVLRTLVARVVADASAPEAESTDRPTDARPVLGAFTVGYLTALGKLAEAFDRDASEDDRILLRAPDPPWKVGGWLIPMPDPGPLVPVTGLDILPELAGDDR